MYASKCKKTRQRWDQLRTKTAHRRKKNENKKKMMRRVGVTKIEERLVLGYY
jgi:hypothetical protein